MRTALVSLAAAAALALSGCVPMPPTPEQAFVDGALRLLDDAGAVFPERDPGVTREAAMLEIGEGVCVAREEVPDDAPFGLDQNFSDGLFSMALAGAMQVDQQTASSVIDLAVEHLCDES